jgi:hypothetical protein
MRTARWLEPAPLVPMFVYRMPLEPVVRTTFASIV